jgi:hypothetical protein
LLCNERLADGSLSVYCCTTVVFAYCHLKLNDNCMLLNLTAVLPGHTLFWVLFMACYRSCNIFWCIVSNGFHIQ